MSPRLTPGQLVVGVLFALLGFGVVVQVSQTTQDQLQGARQADLVRILDDLGEREERLRAEARDLEDTRGELLSGSDQAATALEESRQRAETLGVLAGTIPAREAGSSSPSRTHRRWTRPSSWTRCRSCGTQVPR